MADGTIHTDVAIIGAGPAGTTCGSLLRKYDPSIKVSIFERETFPRDHVGESHLPLISRILNEMGVWDKVEAAGFPIKVGATYRWGKTTDLWDFHFVPNGELVDEPRPAKFVGQRTETAFQVDRAIYDKILADHASELGCGVCFETGVKQVEHEGDRVTGLILENGERVEAACYVDASGGTGVLRRGMGVGVQDQTNLKNIAVWDYWQNAEWAVSVGVGGTRVLVMSLGYGWLWFIPLGPKRTSLGLVCPAEYYKKCGLSTEQLYRKAISEDPLIASLIKNATCEGKLSATKDWSFVADRMAGENWFLVGEALGFADPILAAGLTLSHASAKECAYSILESNRGADAGWIKSEYEHHNRRRVLQHIRFADYWYTANANFSELKEYTREIARDAGLELDADQAFQWLGTGGFVEEDMGIGGLGTVDMARLQQISQRFSQKPPTVLVNGYNVFLLKLKGAVERKQARYLNGRVLTVPALERNGKTLPLHDLFGMIVSGLKASPRIDHLFSFLSGQLGPRLSAAEPLIFNCLEAMAQDGWVACKKVEGVPSVVRELNLDTPYVATNRDLQG